MDKRTNLEFNIRIAKCMEILLGIEISLKKRMFLKSKINILENCVIATLTYEAQTWALTKN